MAERRGEQTTDVGGGGLILVAALAELAASPGQSAMRITSVKPTWSPAQHCYAKTSCGCDRELRLLVRAGHGTADHAGQWRVGDLAKSGDQQCPGNQTDPHVSGDLVFYTDANSVSTIRYYGFRQAPMRPYRKVFPANVMCFPTTTDSGLCSRAQGAASRFYSLIRRHLRFPKSIRSLGRIMG
jgi:hypothetical protein